MKTPSKNIKDGSIYFLFDEDTLVYVGLSVNPCSRIGTHTRDKTFTHYRIMSCRKERMFYWESILITRYKPKYNKAGLERKKPPKQKVKTKFSHPPKHPVDLGLRRVGPLGTNRKLNRTFIYRAKTCRRLSTGG